MELGAHHLGRRAGLKKTLLLGVVALGAAVSGYGAWQAHTHGSAQLDVLDHAGRTATQRWSQVKDAQVTLRDPAGVTLVEASLTPPFGQPAYSGPTGAVDCRLQEQQGGESWQRCFEAQSRWVATWAPRVASARVQVGACTIESVPVERRVYSDWWLWWVPLPHVGGTPLTLHSLALHIDSARCVALTGP